MKRHEVYYLSSSSRGPKPNGPLRTFLELAGEFGICPQALVAALGHDKDAPKPWSKHRTGTYYEADAMRSWWIARQGNKT